MSSVGSASVVSGFNFTKAAEMRAAAAARMEGNSTGAQPGANPDKPSAGTARACAPFQATPPESCCSVTQGSPSSKHGGLPQMSAVLVVCIPTSL